MSRGEAGGIAPALHLLWALPVAVAVAAVLGVYAAVLACGVSGCSGGGYGPVTDGQALAAGVMVLSGVVVAAPLYLVRWIRRGAVRVAVAVTVAVAWSAVAWLLFTSA